MHRIFLAVFLSVVPAFGQAQDAAEEANARFGENQFAEAAVLYEKIPPAQRDAVTYNRLGISYHLSNQLRAAENAYKAALRVHSDYPESLNNLAALYYSQRKFSDAERQVRRAMEKSPENAAMRVNLRAARYARENTRAARAAADGMSQEDALLVKKVDGDLLQLQILLPRQALEQADLHEKRGDSLFARRLYEEAVIEYKKSIELDRYNASTMNRLGLAYHQAQNLREAERYYREAGKLNPYFSEVFNNIATTYYSRQRYDEALSQYQKALKIRPDSATVLLNMGQCLFDMKRYDEAQAATQRALMIDPRVGDRASGLGSLVQSSRRADPVVSFYFARIYALYGDKSRAISYLHRALDEGFIEFSRIKNEPAFAVLQDEEGYARLMERIVSLSTSNAH
jgi:protein O-GlcNAc transferase